MGMRCSNTWPTDLGLFFYRLLQAPFDFSQAFDQALKKIVVALPNRPSKESSDDTVRVNANENMVSTYECVDVLLCLHRQLRRICMQSSHT